MENSLYERIGEDRVLTQTGRSTYHWIILLKRWGIDHKGDAEAAKYLQEEYDLSSWWSQMIVVRCEYRMGLRSRKPFPRMPQDLRKSLLPKNLFDRFTSLTPSHRREYIEWILEAKRPETRNKRIRKVVLRLKESKNR